MSNRKFSIVSSAGLVFAAAIWGFAFVIVKDSLDYIGAIWMLAFRFTIAAVCMSLVFCKKFKLMNKSYWIHGAILGFLLFSAYAWQTIGCKYTTAGKNAFLTTIYVVLVPIIGWPLNKKKPSVLVFVAALLSITGIGLLALKNENGSLLSMNIGDILTLVCGVFYAVHILYVEKFDADEDPLLLTILQFVFAALFSWIAAPLMDRAIPLAALTNMRVVTSMLYLGIFSTMIAFMLQNVCLKYVPSALASLFLSLESVFGVLFGTLLLHEQMTPRMLIGCVLIFSAIMLAEVVPQLTQKKE
jgi:drug/metabolite transporter (DMT)-like permease